MTTNTQLVLLLNSLTLPLCGFIIGATLAFYCGLNEGITILFSVIGFWFGIKICRRQLSQVINIKEVSNV